MNSQKEVKILKFIEGCLFAMLSIISTIILYLFIQFGIKTFIIIYIFMFFLWNLIQYKLFREFEINFNIPENINHKLTKFGKRNFAKLRRYFSKQGYYSNMYLSLDKNCNGIDGYIAHREEGKQYIYISTKSLNTITINGLKSFIEHEVGHHIHNDLVYNNYIKDFFIRIGFKYVGNLISRIIEFRADKNAFLKSGTGLYQYFLQFELDSLRGNFYYYHTFIYHIFGIKLTGSHPTPKQRIYFLKNKYKINLKTILFLLIPFSILPVFKKKVKVKQFFNSK